MSSRKITDACKELQDIIPEFKAQCSEAGIDVLVYCTYRSNEEQDRDYASSRPPLSGSWKTDKQGGESKHNCVDEHGLPASRAFDCVPIKGNIALWTDLYSFEKMGEIGRGLGLIWGGQWKRKDRVHFEMRD